VCASCRWTPGSIAARYCCRQGSRSTKRRYGFFAARPSGGAGRQMIVEVLARLPLLARPQPTQGLPTPPRSARRKLRSTGVCPAEQLERQVRAFNPFPGASCTLDRQACSRCGLPKRLAVRWPAGGDSRGGQRTGIVVACGAGALRLMELQRAGGRRLSAAQFLLGTPVSQGSRCAGRCLKCNDRRQHLGWSHGFSSFSGRRAWQCSATG
jgi:hypothetical protein